jgi:hypothetical protein
MTLQGDCRDRMAEIDLAQKSLDFFGGDDEKQKT